MKKEFSANQLPDKGYLWRREQAQDIEKNIFTTNQQTGLAEETLYTRLVKQRMAANKRGNNTTKWIFSTTSI